MIWTNVRHFGHLGFRAKLIYAFRESRMCLRVLLGLDEAVAAVDDRGYRLQFFNASTLVFMDC